MALFDPLLPWTIQLFALRNTYSINPSARTRNDSEIVNPIAWAVL
jgi:hypothetical protein